MSDSSVQLVRPTRPYASWCRSSSRLIKTALSIVDCGPGDRVLDIGCGDGTLLMQAVMRGATPIGIEIDRSLADVARANLGATAEIYVGDVVDIDLAEIRPTVVTGYLTRALLQRLRPQLGTLASHTKVVTLDMPVVGWAPSQAVANCFLYVLPARFEPVSGLESGWPHGGYIFRFPVDTTIHFSIDALHPAGSVAIQVETMIGEVDVRVGCDRFDYPGLLAVDFNFPPHGGGTTVVAKASSPSMGEVLLVGIYDGGCHQIACCPLDGERLEAVVNSLRGRP